AEVARRRGLVERHLLRQGHEPLGRRRHIFREPARRISHELAYRVRKKAEIALESGCFAEHRFARTAIRTHAARQPRIDVNTVAHGHVGDLTPDFHDHSGGVEPNTGGKPRQMIPQLAAGNRAHVSDDAGGLHLNQHVARTRLRNFHRINPQWLSRLMKTCSTHGRSHRFPPTHALAAIPEASLRTERSYSSWPGGRSKVAGKPMS